MPVYCYKTEDGELIEWEFSRGSAPATLTLGDGEVAFRDYRTELSGMKGFVKKSGSSHPSRPWPMTCVASGVHADQGAELSEHLGRRGCPTEVVDGDPVYTSAAHRKKALKIRKFFDKS